MVEEEEEEEGEERSSLTIHTFTDPSSLALKRRGEVGEERRGEERRGGERRGEVSK